MKDQRWKHKNEEEERVGDVGVRNGGGLEGIYRKGVSKYVVTTINGSKKTCKNTFFNLTTFQNVFYVVQTTVQKRLMQFRLYNPEDTFGFRIK